MQDQSKWILLLETKAYLLWAIAPAVKRLVVRLLKADNDDEKISTQIITSSPQKLHLLPLQPRQLLIEAYRREEDGVEAHLGHERRKLSAVAHRVYLPRHQGAPAF